MSPSIHAAMHAIGVVLVCWLVLSLAVVGAILLRGAVRVAADRCAWRESFAHELDEVRAVWEADYAATPTARERRRGAGPHKGTGAPGDGTSPEPAQNPSPRPVR